MLLGKQRGALDPGFNSRAYHPPTLLPVYVPSQSKWSFHKKEKIAIYDVLINRLRDEINVSGRNQYKQGLESRMYDSCS